MKVLICGDRNWTDYQRILDVVRGLVFIYGESLIIVQGDADGADSMAKCAAIELGLEHRDYPALWSNICTEPCVIKYRGDGTPYNVLAGPIRNQQMLDCEHPDMVIAFHRNISVSKGTKDMVSRSRRAGIRCVVIDK